MKFFLKELWQNDDRGFLVIILAIIIGTVIGITVSGVDEIIIKFK